MPLASGRLSVLSRNEEMKVHNASIELLKNTGVIFDSQEARNVFAKHGAKIDGKTVFIDEQLIEKAIEKSPSYFKHTARNDSHSVMIGAKQKQLIVSSMYGTVYVQDLTHGRRKGLLLDHINITKLSHASDIVNVIGGEPITASDIDQKDSHLILMLETIKNTDKAIYSMPGAKESIDETFELIKIAFGNNNCFEEKHITAAPVCPLSPLRYDQIGCETLLTYAKYKQPVYVNSCIVSGVSGPISLLGTVTLMNTEILAGLALTQIVNPGSPYVYVPGSTVANMKSGIYNTGSPEANLIDIAGIQMAIDLYNLPTRAMAGLTDAKDVDCQAGFESMQNFMLLMLGGVHFINEALGCLDSIMTTSYEKFILDEEMIKRVIRIMDGLNTHDSEISLDVIKDVGHNGEYLTHESTYQRFRERWRPSVSYWDSYDDWVAEGSPNIVEVANKKYKEILQEAPEQLLDKTIENDMLRYLNKRSRIK